MVQYITARLLVLNLTLIYKSYKIWYSAANIVHKYSSLIKFNPLQITDIQAQVITLGAYVYQGTNKPQIQEELYCIDKGRWWLQGGRDKMYGIGKGVGQPKNNSYLLMMMD